jgi:hypothetical protein
MKNSIPLGRMSPCLRIFIESLLAGADCEIVDDDPVSNERFAMNPALASRISLESDKNYN